MFFNFFRLRGYAVGLQLPSLTWHKSIEIMEIEKIENALTSALSLLNNEVESIEYDELKNEYLSVIEKLEIALKAINQDE